MPDNKFFVTQPSLPPLKDFIESLEKIWLSKILTNNGIFHQELENKLAEYLGVKFISLFSNGTIALITALQALKISGEVITTPFSFVATTHALYWNNIKPVFCDIDPVWGNLDPDKIEALITPLTSAILPVHVYGNPCNIDSIQKIADKFGLKVIFDAAHAFAVKQNDKSILNYGDLSILSFHATKVFNTIEGGAIVCHDEQTKKQIDYLKNFGFEDELTVVTPGINGKMNELQAAYGLLQLHDIDANIEKRNLIAERYRQRLKHTKGIRYLENIQGVKHNGSYFPIFITDDYPLSRDGVYEKLKGINIYTRRYFYPLISSFPIYNKLESSLSKKLMNATIMSKQVLCLPIYALLELKMADFICDQIDL